MIHTNEFLARCFAAYWGADYLETCYKETWKITGETIDILLATERLDSRKIILNTLSNISDEDAVVLCKIINVDYDNSTESEAHYDLAGLRDDIAANGDDVFDQTFTTSQQALDFLRSKGYDCGYAHIPSLIEAGIALQKQ